MLNEIWRTTAVFLGAIFLSCTIKMAVAADQRKMEGVTFDEVWKIITTPPQGGLSRQVAQEAELYGTAEKPVLPQHSGNFSTLWSLVTGKLRGAAQRTISNSDDYHEYFEKYIHANGVCFSGIWEVTSESAYSGLFQKGSSALIIGRISTANPVTIADKGRSFGLAGKLFPTTVPKETVRTANFFTVNDLNPRPITEITNVEFTNEPPVDFGGFLNPLKIVNGIFEEVDKSPGFRPLYPISRAGLSGSARSIAPRWIRIQLTPEDKRISLGTEEKRTYSVGKSDFRVELLEKNALSLKRNARGLRFLVEAADGPANGIHSKAVPERRNWKMIGYIQVNKEMVVSFGCDRRLHFPHPKFDDSMN